MKNSKLFFHYCNFFLHALLLMYPIGKSLRGQNFDPNVGPWGGEFPVARAFLRSFSFFMGRLHRYNLIKMSNCEEK